MIHLFGRSAPGSRVLSRSEAGSVNWPRCALCHRIVDAHGIENETETSIEIWAECTGVLLDPRTGETVANSPRLHAPKRSSVVIRKGPAFSMNRLRDIIARQAFFAPEGERQYQQDLSADGVNKRWSAG